MKFYEKPTKGRANVGGQMVNSWHYKGYVVLEYTGADYGRRGWVRKEKAWQIRHLATGKQFDLVPSAETQPTLKEALWYVDKLNSMRESTKETYGTSR